MMPTNAQASLAVIFDMDGVLIDSYRAHFESWRIVAAEEGLQITEEQFSSTFGRTSREIIAALWGDRTPGDDRIRELDERKEAAFRELIRDNFPIMPGAPELLDALHAAGFGVGIGSSGPPENVALTVEKLAKRHVFGAIVTGKDVTRGKPDPQVFLLAAERLNVPPARCAVVEDAPPGIEAAHRAGMKAVGLASTGRTPEMLSKADLVVKSLRELAPERFRELILGSAQSGE
ncbi:MAG: HAD family hydrolase [Thermogutta sp.]